MGKFSRFVSLARQAKQMLDGDGDRSPSRPTSRPNGFGTPGPAARHPRHSSQGSSDASAAVARYAYLLRTAPPEQLERLHREAFERLTPAQREELRVALSQGGPAHGGAHSASAGDLAVAATRVEASRPGALQRILGRASRDSSGSAPGGNGASRNGLGRKAALGGAGLAAGGLLAAVAGGAVVSTVGTALLEQAGRLGVDFSALAEGLDPAAFGLDSLGEIGLGDIGLGDLGLENLGGLGDVAQGVLNLGEGDLGTLGDLFGR